MEYKLIICGGTFDRLHAGHKAFLHLAFEKGKRVIIGLTSNAYIAKYKTSESILSFDQRKKELEKFLQEENLLERADIVAINSKFDQTQVPNVENTALLVSSETYATGLEINKEREKNGLLPLPLLVMPLVASSTGEKISSTAIRSGLFDLEGNFIPQKVSTPITIPDSLRSFFHKPFGTLFMKDLPEEILREPEKLVTVGDVITKRIHDLHIKPKIAVVDFRVERKDTHRNLVQLGFTSNETVMGVQNLAGQIMPRVWTVLADMVKNIQTKESFAVTVEGEEDLFVIPLILLLPIGYKILYGQPGEGVVAVIISEENKKLLLQLLKNYL